MGEIEHLRPAGSPPPSPRHPRRTRKPESEALLPPRSGQARLRDALSIPALRGGLLLLIALARLTTSVQAATALDEVRYSPDVTVVLGGLTVDDERLVTDDLSGSVTIVSLAAIPAPIDLNAYHLLANGDHLLSFDTAVVLSGLGTVRPGDVVRFDGVNFASRFASRLNGIPEGVVTDAVSIVNGGDALFSFDITVDLGGGVLADDEDLVRFDGAAFALFFDGSAAGVPPDLDLDGAHHLDTNGHLLLSFDGSGTVGTVSFDDEDVLEYDPISGAWELAYDGPALHAGWPVADLDALYATPTCIDSDGDGYGSPGGSPACPAGIAADCDDTSATTFPGASPNDSATACMKDDDGDDYGDATPPPGVTAGSDCDDSAASVNPGATELCNGADDDCDGATDEGLGQTSCGTGACQVTVDNCVGGQPQTCVPGTPTAETCNGADDDCDGATDEDFVCDVAGPVISASPVEQGGVLGINGTATDDEASDSGVADVVLGQDSINLSLAVDPFTAGDPAASFRVTQGDAALDAQGSVVVTDGVGNSSTLPVSFHVLAAGPVEAVQCTGEGNLLSVEGDATSSGTTACGAQLPTDADLQLYPEGFVPSPETDPFACRVMIIDSPISGDTVMVFKKDGPFEADLRLLFSAFDEGTSTFPPFLDVTESVEPTLLFGTDPTRVKGKGKWSKVKIACAIQTAVDCAGVADPNADSDGDGSPICVGGAVEDCNDANAAIGPGAAEVCNGLDDDCDGQVDEGLICDTVPPVCSGEPAEQRGAPVISGAATEALPGESGIATVALAAESINLDLLVDPFTVGDPQVTFSVGQGDTTLDAQGTVVVTDVGGNQCLLPVNFRVLASGEVDSVQCSGEGNLLRVDGNAPQSGTSGCGAQLPTEDDPALPPGYEASPPGDPSACRVMTIDSPISGADTVMILKKDGPFEPRLRLLFSPFDEESGSFPPFVDVTEAVDAILAFGEDPTRVKGKGKWSTVKVMCALQSEVCNGIDDDGDGLIDEGLPVGDDSVDADADGSPLCPADPALADCNDQDPAIGPGAAEICNGLDDDCDGEVDEGLACDTNPPACSADPVEQGGVLGFDGTATDDLAGDAGIADVDLTAAVNLTLTVDPFTPGAASVTFRVEPSDATQDAQGTVVVADSASNECTLPVNFHSLATGPVSGIQCSGEGNQMSVDGNATQDGSAGCGLQLPAADDPDLPPGFEPSPPDDPNACRVMTIDSPISGDTVMVLKKDGPFDPTLRILLSALDETSGTFPPFEDVTISVEEVLSLGADPTRVKGKGKWSTVKVMCARQTEICNGADDDGDGLIDENLPIGQLTIDADGDGATLCAPNPADADCNDQNPAIAPGATELCNGLDDDCDGEVDEGIVCDANPPLCNEVPTAQPGIEMRATDDLAGDSGIVTVRLASGSTNLVLECDAPFPAVPPGPTDCGTLPTGELSATFRALQVDTALDAEGTVAVVDAAGNTCTLPVSFAVLDPGAVQDEELCAGEGNRLLATGDAGTGGTAECSAEIPSRDEPELPSGFEPSPDDDPNPCRVMTIDSPISGDTIMVFKKDGEFEPRLRLLLSRFENGAFQRFEDVTDSVAKIDDISGDPTRVKGKGKWSKVKVACAIQTEVCNGIDDDGDGLIDENLPLGTDAVDEDGDGSPLCAAEGVQPDCNDQNPDIFPGAPEACNGLDDDCDGAVDEDIFCADLTVAIDIKPGSDPNSVGCQAEEKSLPVAILSDPTFDATGVNIDTVRFGRTGTEALEVHVKSFKLKSHRSDVNGDGLEDLVLHFRLDETGFSCADIPEGFESITLIARLTGDSPSGSLEGEDSIRLTGGGGLSCNKNHVCEPGEDCNSCPHDCVSGSLGAVCGNGVCDAGDGEDCVSCPRDCNGVQGGNPVGRFCCGDGDGQNPLPCSDDLCGTGGFSCTDVPSGAGSFCCGDGTCHEGFEDSLNCELDCPIAPPPSTCGNGVCDPGEDCTNCSQDCEGKLGGRTSDRFCCGNGITETPEGDGSRCDGNF